MSKPRSQREYARAEIECSTLLLNVKAAAWISIIKITPFLKKWDLHDRSIYQNAAWISTVSFSSSHSYPFIVLVGVAVTKILLLWSEREREREGRMGWGWTRTAAGVHHRSCWLEPSPYLLLGVILFLCLTRCFYT